MVHDDKPVGLNGVQVNFDDERAVSDAGVMLVATLAQRLGIEALAGRSGAVASGSARRRKCRAQGHGDPVFPDGAWRGQHR